ncbi:MAG: PaaI family thioesterase [Peptococcaceae bacterium]|nr:PaaI family thioesterase [Peptococcaceae bacterium]
MKILEKEGNMCFGCSTDNPIGLKLKFTFEENICISTFTAESCHQGWPDCVHGGIISTLLDEVMSQWLWFNDIAAMTAELSIRFSKAVPLYVPLRLESRKIGGRGKLYIMESKIILPDGNVPCRGEAKFLRYPESP